MGNVQHGLVDRASENLRTWLRLALIKNDLPGASSQKAMSHSREISSNISVFQRKIAKNFLFLNSTFLSFLLEMTIVPPVLWSQFENNQRSVYAGLVPIMFCSLLVRTQRTVQIPAWIDYAWQIKLMTVKDVQRRERGGPKRLLLDMVERKEEEASKEDEGWELTAAKKDRH